MKKDSLAYRHAISLADIYLSQGKDAANEAARKLNLKRFEMAVLADYFRKVLKEKGIEI
jgi:hypothetical protein